MARNSLEYAFVEGKSLWSKPQTFIKTPECSLDKPNSKTSNRCQEFLQANVKARLQWQLETEFATFEMNINVGTRYASPQ
jgi:hypothetical protein